MKTEIVFHENKTIYEDGTFSILIWAETINAETGEPINKTK